MTLNELLTKQNFLSKIQLKNGDSELSKSLKVKVMSNRIEYAKVRKQFDEDTQEFIKNLTDEHFRELQNKPELTKLTNEANESYIEYVNGKGLEEVSCKEKPITEEDFEEILEVNADNDVEINGNKLSAADFLEIFYTLFVEENGKD